MHDKLYHLVAKAFATWDDPLREFRGLLNTLGLSTARITREATRTPMLTVSAILPELPMAAVRRVMDGLETSVGNGFYDIPRTLNYARANLLRYPRFARLRQLLGDYLDELRWG